MSSKMREAVQEAYRRGFSHAREGRSWHDSLENADEIISRYGDLEFTLEEVRGMLEGMGQGVLNHCHFCFRQFGHFPKTSTGQEDLIDRILSRHLGKSESGDGMEMTGEQYDQVAKNMKDIDARAKTRKKVRELLLEEQYAEAIADDVAEILSRHLGESESGESLTEESLKEYVKRTANEAEQMPAWKRESLGPTPSDETPTIKASEIERQIGEKVPEWARWLTKSAQGYTQLYEERPAVHLWSWVCFQGRRSYLSKQYVLPGPWDQSLRRIIHDEPSNIQYCGECGTKHRPDEDCCTSLEYEGNNLDREEEPDLVDAVLDYRTREGMATLDDLCKRVAAIEKALQIIGVMGRNIK